jgi:hypothetical protein
MSGLDAIAKAARERLGAMSKEEVSRFEYNSWADRYNMLLMLCGVIERAAEIERENA